jgi:hypothetical protein
MRRDRLLTWLGGALLGGFAFVVCLEAVLRVLPVSTATRTGYHVAPSLLTYPPHHQWRVATGWDLRNPQMLTSNNFGFVADHDFVPDANAVALIGDSYVEASMLDARNRPGAQLERELGGVPVYAMGGPGSSLLDYVERLRFARERFGVEQFVLLLEAGDVRQALCGSGNVHSECLDRVTLIPHTERRPAPGPLRRWASRSALAQYVASQLKFDGSRFGRALYTRQVPAHPAPAGSTVDSGETAEAPAYVDAVARTFFARLEAVPGVRRVILIVDGRRDARRAVDLMLVAERNRFIELARARGFIVVDAEPLYAAHAANSPLSLDVGPYDGHLNALGVALVAKSAARALSKP